MTIFTYCYKQQQYVISQNICHVINDLSNIHSNNFTNSHWMNICTEVFHVVDTCLSIQSILNITAAGRRRQLHLHELCLAQKYPSTAHVYHLWIWQDNVFVASVCVSVRNALTFESLDLKSSFFVWRYIFRISRSSSYIHFNIAFSTC